MVPGEQRRTDETRWNQEIYSFDHGSWSVHPQRQSGFLLVTCYIPTNRTQQSWDLARTLNTKAAEIRDSKPDTFGFFLTLGNILDTNEALAEIAYGFDELEADGVCLFTRYDSDENFGDPNKYLGHREFGPIWKELDRRKAVVFVHPTHPRDISRANFLLYQPIVDYPHETTRTAMDMLLSGTRSEFPDCQVILSHAGGTLPYLIPRVEALLVSGHHQQVGLVLIPTERILRDYRSFHFDIALSTSNATIKTLLETGVPKENILFGVSVFLSMASNGAFEERD